MPQYHVSRNKIVTETVLVVAENEDEATEAALNGDWEAKFTETLRTASWNDPELIDD